ncbi:MAG: galactokinase [Aggregatilineales bacterium]
MTLEQRIISEFERHFAEPPTYIARAPGRVNLIGEHTDYNDGFVLPMAIDRAVWIALRPRADGYVVVHSLDFSSVAEFSPVEMAGISQRHPAWVEYLKGVAWSLQEAGYPLKGWEGVVAGDVPVGAGLSSSAAIELATARAFAAVSGFAWDPVEIAKICQRAENEWVGVKSGIMDQMISGAGVAGRALLIDCRWLTHEAVPLPPETLVVILDTSTRRELTSSKYNERFEQCQQAAAFFNVPALRDVTLAQLNAVTDLLDPVIVRRARHVITENERTLAAAAALRVGDAAAFGRLMDESHISMRDDFEITNDALNAIVEIARRQPSCYGARMTGGGFGGCAVALVRADAAEAFGQATAVAYHEATGLEAMVYVTSAAEGASLQAL